jgi:hypothetical protein
MGKVFIVDAEWKADAKIFIVDAEWKSDSKEYVVSAEWKSDEKVYVVDAEWKADRKVFLVDAEWKADKKKNVSSNTFSSRSLDSNYSDTTDNSRSTLNRLKHNTATEKAKDNSSSGCFGTIFKWVITFALIWGVLKYFGLTDKIFGSDTTISTYKVATDSLNLRSEPNPNSNVLSIIPRDSILKGINDSSQVIGSNKWIYVTNNIDSGWVNEKYIIEE